MNVLPGHRTTSPLTLRCADAGACRFVLTSVLAALLSLPVFAQPVKMLSDLGVHYSRFNAETLHGVSDGRPGLHIRLGAAYVFGKDNRLSAGTSLGLHTRRMKREVDEYHFINRFWTIEAPVFFNIDFSERWSGETGVAFLFYSTDQSALRDTQADTRVSVGEGFQNFDVAPFIGAVYRFSDHVLVGSRFRLGLLPMAEYQAIGYYGSVSPVQTDLYAATFEIFLRLSTF